VNLATHNLLREIRCVGVLWIDDAGFVCNPLCQPQPLGTTRTVLVLLYEIRRLTKTGIFTTSRTSPKAMAAANSQATTEKAKGAMAIP
jgi:hypothetical protein